MEENKKAPAPIISEQAERNFSQLSQCFLKSEQFFFKAESAVKPEDLSSLYDCTNAKN